MNLNTWAWPKEKSSFYVDCFKLLLVILKNDLFVFKGFKNKYKELNQL